MAPAATTTTAAANSALFVTFRHLDSAPPIKLQAQFGFSLSNVKSRQTGPGAYAELNRNDDKSSLLSLNAPSSANARAWNSGRPAGRVFYARFLDEIWQRRRFFKLIDPD